MNKKTLTAELGKLGIDVKDGKVRRADVKAVIDNVIAADGDWSESDSLAAVNKKLGELGISVDYKPARDDGHAETIKTISIDPSDLGQIGSSGGLMRHMFSTIVLKVSAGVKDESGMILLDYSYKHPGGGSNGKSLRYDCYKGVWRDPS